MKIVDIIKSEAENHVFVWKYPGEDFNTLSQLIVKESQEAIFYMNGQALDLFKAGRYTLHTQNIPLLNKIINIPTGGESPFHCEVYFINKTEQMAIPWGIGDVNYLDPTNNDYAFKIGASGEMSLRAADSRKLITKLVGTETILERETLKKYFKALIISYIKTLLPDLLRERQTSIFEVERYLTDFSGSLKERISEEMDDYGISLEKFWINNISKPEDDPFYQTINRQRGEKVTLNNQGELDITEADYARKKELIRHSGEVEKRRMDIDVNRYEQEQLGYTYRLRREFDVMEKVAANEGSGSEFRNAAMGLGMSFSTGGVFGNIMGAIASNTMTPDFVNPGRAASENKVRDEIPGMIHIKKKEEEKSDSFLSFKEKVENLKYLMENGLLKEEEFEALKQQLLKEAMGGGE